MKIKIVLISMSFFFGTQLYGQLPKGFLSKIKTPSFQVQKGKSYKLASAELMPFKELIANKSITVENKTKSKPVSPNSKKK